LIVKEISRQILSEFNEPPAHGFPKSPVTRFMFSSDP
jgi:hypothetical protein